MESLRPSLIRPLVAFLAVLGVAETSYLAWLSHHGEVAFCPAVAGPGCGLTLASVRAYFLGLPLPLLGYSSYALVAALALLPGLFRGPLARQRASRWTLLGGLGLTGAMALFSLDLMGVMVFELSAYCPWCVVSAVLSVSLFACHLVQAWRQPPFLPALAGGLVLGLAGILTARVLSPELPPLDVPSEVHSSSSPGQLALAEHLAAVGAKFYGTLWCRHCWEQKELFGKEASERLPFVDCSGSPPPPGISGFPTWELGRRRVSGVVSLEELVRLSEFPGEVDVASPPPEASR